MGMHEALEAARDNLEFYQRRYSERVAHTEGIVALIDDVLCEMEKHSINDATNPGVKVVIDQMKQSLRNARRSEASALDKVACYKEIIANIESKI